ncbi:MAG: hypothetical protein ACR2KE_05220 [Candidatus Nanopelagicales bacterium]
MKRVGLVVVGLLAAALLVACSSDPVADMTSPTPTVTTPTPTPTPEIIVWAGEVCVARDALLASVVDMATSLTYDPQDPASVGEQFQRQIPGQLDGVEAAARDLGTALGGVPLDYVEAAASITALQADLDRLSASKDTALGHVSAAQGAGDPVSAGVEWLQAAIAAKETYDAGMVVKDSLGAVVGSADGDVGDAFATAPECR